MYSRLSEETAKDYDKVKIALMKRYDLTKYGYHGKFRAAKLEVDESPDQFIVRLDRYLLQCLELSDTEQTFDGLKDLIVKEQFIDSCPKDLAIHLRERAPETLAKIAKITDLYLEAHGKHLFSPASRKPNVQNTRGHKGVICPTMAKKCFLCGKQGHEARNCRSGGWRSGGQNKDGNSVQRNQVSASCLVQPSPLKIIKQVNHIILTFLWNRKDKVTRLSAVNTLEESGIKMIDIESMIKASRLAWLKRIFNNNDSTWKFYLIHVLKKLGDL